MNLDFKVEPNLSKKLTNLNLLIIIRIQTKIFYQIRSLDLRELKGFLDLMARGTTIMRPTNTIKNKIFFSVTRLPCPATE